MANSEFQRKHKIYTMCLERTIMYLALFVVSGYFMKYWTWRCKKFSCTSLKNIFLLPQFVPTYFLLQNALCSGQSSSWEHAECLGSIPGVSREHLEMALQALAWVKRWEAPPGWIQWLWRTSPTSINAYVPYFCFWIMFLFLLSTWFFNDYLDFKKFFYFSSPAQRYQVYQYYNYYYFIAVSKDTLLKCLPVFPPTAVSFLDSQKQPSPSCWWRISIKMPAQASEALCSLLVCPGEKTTPA